MIALYEGMQLPNTPSFHEKMTKDDDVKIGSEKAFGLVFAAVFLIIALWSWVASDGDIRTWAVVVAVVFALLALIKPRLLAPLNKLWFRFGLVLHRVVNPLVMGLLFFVTITPIGLLMRALGKTPLALGFDKQADSYWINRPPPAPAPDSMKRQF